MNKKSFFAAWGLLFTACIWGFAFVVVKDSLNSVGPIWMMAFRFTIAAVGLALIFIKKLKLLNKKTLIDGVITGAFLFLAYAVQTIGCNYTTAGKNAFLTTIYVILVPLISWPLYKKRPQIFVFIAAIMSLTGIGLLALGGGQDSLLKMNIGDILTLICGLFYALHIIWTERCYKNDDDPLLITILQFLFAAIFSWIVAPIYESILNGNPSFPMAALTNGRVILSMLYLGLFSTMIAFSLQNVGLKYVQPSFASLLLSFESVFGVLFSAIFLKEQLSFRMIIGCVLIFFAVILAETKKAEK